MTLFLTSSPSGCPFEPGPDIPVLDTRNHFVANLRAVWPDHAVLGLAIAADPYAYEQNDEMCRVFAQSFANAHLPLTALIPCDARNAEEIGVHIGRTRSTAGRHIQIALKRLRRLMEGNDYE